MENAPVVTWGCWNINDIYRKRDDDAKPWRVWPFEQEITPWHI
jgi:acetolactate synthase-1/2/3 large subunit